MQGAAGMVRQPDGFVRRVAELARRHDVLLIADEVATGFARTGAMFACDLDGVEPDILCLAKGLTGGYLPLAATVCTERVERAFRGPLEDRRTLYHGHTYTGNPLACAAALASLDLIEAHGLVEHVRRSEVILQESLDPLRACPRVRDVRRRGVMVGIELCEDRDAPEPLSYAAPRGKRVCDALRDEGVIVRPLGNVVILMPAPGMAHDLVRELADRVTSAILRLD